MTQLTPTITNMKDAKKPLLLHSPTFNVVNDKLLTETAINSLTCITRLSPRQINSKILIFSLYYRCTCSIPPMVWFVTIQFQHSSYMPSARKMTSCCILSFFSAISDFYVTSSFIKCSTIILDVQYKWLISADKGHKSCYTDNLHLTNAYTIFG